MVPGGLVVKTSLSNAGGAVSIPGSGAKVLHDSWTKSKQQEQYYNKFNKTLKKKKGSLKKGLVNKNTHNSSP